MKIGGRDDGTFAALSRDFERFYPMLETFVFQHGVEGVDLDVPAATSMAVVARLATVGPRILPAGFCRGGVGVVVAGGRRVEHGDDGGLLLARAGDAITWVTVKLDEDDVRASLPELYQTWLTTLGLPPQRLMVDVGTGSGTAMNQGGPAPAGLEGLAARLAAMRSAMPELGGIVGTEYAGAAETMTLGEYMPWRWFRAVQSVLNPPTGYPPPQDAVAVDLMTSSFTEQAQDRLLATVGGGGDPFLRRTRDSRLRCGGVQFLGQYGADGRERRLRLGAGGQAVRIRFIPGLRDHRTHIDGGTLRGRAFARMGGEPPVGRGGVVFQPQQGRHIEDAVGGGQRVRFDDRGRPGGSSGPLAIRPWPRGSAARSTPGRAGTVDSGSAAPSCRSRWGRCA